ncbi:MAG: phosphatidate cytidylyltransferase [Syntrophorhabdaceae bacterium]|nr:phosphatidate cytidylyltransferase [Syntrophorhabdaceae bacterium]
MGELKKRVIAGLCLGPFIFILFYLLPDKFLFVFLAIISFLATIETVNLAMAKERVFIGICVLISFFSLYGGNYSIFVIWVMCSIFLYFTLKAFVSKNYASNVYIDIARGMIAIIFSEIFIVIPLVHFYFLRKLNVFFPLITLFAIWASDTVAYFFGKGFGRRALIPRISPKKTIEGLFGAVAGSIVVILSTIKITGFGILESISVGAAMGLLGQMGDIFESTWKRLCEVKDSSGLIPGHGGILDRLDSFIFTTPFLYHYIAGFKI